MVQRWPFQTNVGWQNTPNYESDGKTEEKEAPSTVLTMRLWLCREECVKSTFACLHSPLEVGPPPLERWAAMFCSLPWEDAENPKNTLPMHQPFVNLEIDPWITLGWTSRLDTSI